MLSIFFNLSIIINTFVIFLAVFLIYQALLGLRQSNTPLLQNYLLVGFFSVYLLSIIFDLMVRLFTLMDLRFMNVYFLQGFLCLMLLVAACLHGMVWLEQRRHYLVLTIAVLSAVTFVLSAMWVKVFVFDFNPFVSMNVIVGCCQVVFAIAVMSHAIYIYMKARQNKTEVYNSERSQSILLVLFALSVLTLAGMDVAQWIWAFIPLNVVSIFVLFLFGALRYSTFISDEHFKNPFRFLFGKIVYRLTVSLAIFIVIAIEAVHYGTLHIVKQELVKVSLSEFSKQLDVLNATINDWVDDKKLRLDVLINVPDEKSKSVYYKGSKLFEFVRSHPEYQDMYILTTAGQPLLHINSEVISLGFVVKEGSYFETIANEVVAHQSSATFIYDQKVVRIGIPVYNEKNEVIAVFVSVVDCTPLLIGLAKKRFGESGEYRLYNEFMLPIDLALPANFKDQSIYSHTKFLSAANNENKLRIYLEVRQSENESLRGLMKAQYYSIFFTALSILMFTLLAFFFVRRIQKPLTILQEGTRRIGNGELQHRIVIAEQDEFFVLAEAFNHMAKTLKSNQQKMLKAEQLMSIGQVSVGLNHEINNPLATVMMSTQFLIGLFHQIEEGKKVWDQKNAELVKSALAQNEIQCFRIRKILKNLEAIHEPVITDYVDGTKMLKINS